MDTFLFVKVNDGNAVVYGVADLKNGERYGVVFSDADSWTGQMFDAKHVHEVTGADEVRMAGASAVSYYEREAASQRQLAKFPQHREEATKMATHYDTMKKKVEEYMTQKLL